MEYNLNTRLNGSVVVTSELHRNKALLQDKSLYKFIWVCRGTVTVEIDHVPMTLSSDEVISLSPLHHLRFVEVDGEYQTLLFNSNFYCIFGHDSEVSCNGFLFNGSSHVMLLKLDEEQSKRLNSIFCNFIDECSTKDNLQEEMLRIVLKRFIITCTRIARAKFAVGQENEKSFDIVRQFYVLVDTYFKEKKQVQDYADMLYRSPKTISNLFAEYGLPSPLKVIHDRVAAEAKRLLLYTNKSAKEIGLILGFEDIATFSRFFKKVAKESISEYRKREKQE
jgi:AraC-like DNA-binding protein